jgi:hypothetical protein
MAVNDILRSLEQSRFYGTVELKFESGRVVLIRKTETMKPSAHDCRDNRGEANEHESPR